MARLLQGNYKWTILGVATGGQAAICFGGLSIPPLAGYLTAEFALSKTEFGAIMSILYLGAAIASFPSGRLSDIFKVKTVLSLSLVGMGLLVASLFLVSSYIGLVTIVFLMGLLGYGVANPVTNKALMSWFPRLNRGTAMGIKQTSVPVGGFLAAIVFSQLAIRFGWRSAFLVGGLAIVLTAIIPLLLYKESPASSDMPLATVTTSKNNASSTHLFLNKNLILISVIAVTFSMVQIAVGTYLVLYLQEVAFFSVVLAGTYLGLTNVGGIAGRICWGVISDRLFGGKRRIVLQIIACISGFSAMSLSYYSYIDTDIGRWLLTLIILILGFTSIGWNGIYHAYLVEVAGKKLAGTATGISLSIVFCGNMAGPLIFGSIVDLSGSYTHAWEAIAILMTFSMIILFLLKENTNE